MRHLSYCGNKQTTQSVLSDTILRPVELVRKVLYIWPDGSYLIIASFNCGGTMARQMSHFWSKLTHLNNHWLDWLKICYTHSYLLSELQ